ncbi:MAG: ATP-binding protein [Candidatus Krumholzibacteria bacterium]|nr:ATP-binding protein [Candidatus Krumholzibacteria bacterium]
MQDFEQLGAFYLGREFDPGSGNTTDNLLLYDARDLTTHGVIVGMTGSGKTGLALALLEEAAIDGIPSIAIDPKGDLGNLLLAFPDLRPEDFRPWVDEAEAVRNGLSPDEFAARTAETWAKGLAGSGQDGARIRRFRDAVDLSIYTPGDTSGRPLQILRSFAAPSAGIMQDATALRDRIMSAVSGLLELLGVRADPVQSREHILLSTILDRAWRAGRNLDIEALINEIMKPPFEKIGVFDIESFYPAKERFGLAMAMNNLIASPGFSAWMEGEPMDVQRLLYTPEGRPRVSIISIAHLSEPERMFFVTMLLNEILAWVRSQSGTGSLRALLYMDEIFGYFPPTANPPSKTPMLTLLKQARAYGFGVLLSTQNPVDLDYKGLANAGTWWIGRLQTERDKMRVLEGLEGAASAAGAAFDRDGMEKTLAGLGNRVFLMRNVHDDAPVIFSTRWVMSFMRGPMTLPQIRKAMSLSQPADAPAAASAHETFSAPSAGSGTARPVLPPGIQEYFLRPSSPAADIVFRAGVAGAGKLHFVDAKAGVDTWITSAFLAPLGEDGFADWEAARPIAEPERSLDRQPVSGAAFGEVPAAALRRQSADQWSRTLVSHMYQNVALDLFACPALKLFSKPGETEGDFTARLSQALRERRDDEVEKLKSKYAARFQTLTDRVRTAQERVEREKSQAAQQKFSAALGAGATILGALMGRRAISAGTVERASTTMRRAGRIGKEQADVKRAGDSLEDLKLRLAEMERQFAEEAEAMRGRFDPAAVEVEKKHVRPRKTDIAIGTIGLCWTPWKKTPEGALEPA